MHQRITAVAGGQQSTFEKQPLRGSIAVFFVEYHLEVPDNIAVYILYPPDIPQPYPRAQINLRSFDLGQLRGLGTVGKRAEHQTCPITTHFSRIRSCKQDISVTLIDQSGERELLERIVYTNPPAVLIFYSIGARGSQLGYRLPVPTLEPEFDLERIAKPTVKPQLERRRKRTGVSIVQRLGRGNHHSGYSPGRLER